ncbi:hypothetical protein DFH07DRAFT_774711 [Mycena maculata]|uniref:Uncharacterized protein n=1 Tax=Mycena maculata TaxID=230809 RepID=A0AAD7IWB6_9AGAR|nr:hypothetical protein DFH07DRAFT_774711 [Mycena maculata]
MESTENVLAQASKKTHTHPELWSLEFSDKIGPNLGLMGLDELHLRMLATSSDDPVEKANAKVLLRFPTVLFKRRLILEYVVLTLMKKGCHWVLVVLLFGSVITNESLHIFLDTAFALHQLTHHSNGPFQREIILQAVSMCYGLSIAVRPRAHASPRPSRGGLPSFGGEKEEGRTYRKAGLKSFFCTCVVFTLFHRTGEEPLREEEIGILSGVPEPGKKLAELILTPMTDVVTLSVDAVLDDMLVERILLSGYSCYPVHPTRSLGRC